MNLNLANSLVAETSNSEFSVKKRKFEDHDFKSKSNKIQFRFNSELLELLDKVERSAKIKENKHLDELKSLIENRNKFICIADKSPGGWLTVAEYQDDDIASDSDDQKKIRAAEARALRKKKLSQTPFKRYNYSSNLPAVPENRTGSGGESQLQQSLVRSKVSQGDRNLFRDFGSKRIPQPSDRCFECGQLGHWCRFHKQPEVAQTKEEK